MAQVLAPRGTRHLKRYRQILAVLGRHGFGYLLVQFGLGGFLPPLARVLRRGGGSDGARPQQLRAALEELGPTFVKLGQLMSTRPDVLPAEYIAELAKLQDAVAPEPTGAIRRAIELELGQPVEALYAVFANEPLAAASIGQVHAARLHDGQEVVVKVQRPGIRAHVETDLEILLDLAHLAAENSSLARRSDVEALAREFAHTLLAELDYRREARNADRFRRNMADEPNVHIPAVVWSHTTERVLTLERVWGIKITDIAALDRAGVDRHALAIRSARVILREMFIDGFFHADPHPGNFFVQADGVLAVVDFGMVGRLDDLTRERLLDLLIAVVRRDTARAVEDLIDLGVASGRIDRAGLQRELEELLDEYYDVALSEVDLSRLLSRGLEVMQRHQLRLPASLALLTKTLVVNEGVGRELDPSFRMVEVAEPMTREALRELRPAGWLLRQTRSSAVEWARFGLEAPERGRRLLGRLERGDLELSVSVRSVDAAARRLERMVNRLALSILTAGFIIGLAILTLAYQPPGWSLLSRFLFVAGSLAVGVLGAWLLLSLVLSRRG